MKEVFICLTAMALVVAGFFPAHPAQPIHQGMGNNFFLLARQWGIDHE
jgi:hypothetical protein